MASLSGYVNPEWLDEQFVERALREGEADPDIVVKHIQVKAATAVGDNYVSLMYRVCVEFVRGSGKREKQSLIPEETLVLEDLSVSGFKVAERQKGLDLEHSMLAIQRLAMFHAASIVLAKKDPSSMAPYSVDIITKSKEVEKFYSTTMLSFAEEVAERQKGLDLEHSMLAIQRLAIFHAASAALAVKDPMSMALYHIDFITKSKEIEQFYSKTVLSFAKEVKTWPEYSEKYAQKLIKLSNTLYSVTVEKRKRLEGPDCRWFDASSYELYCPSGLATLSPLFPPPPTPSFLFPHYMPIFGPV
uniref:CHK kinase-like domain-containing protein n=1 Tax=Timema cristinae TaxID=61476 RepID=A0A7R9GVY2_TIMCR|nr:unnamed protein product [Timema cristinae]